jgi:hypothetical protein
MSVFISKKLSFLLLICAWCAALAVIFSFNYAAAGPKLGPTYDLLLGFRSDPPVSAEILLIETDEIIEPGDLFSVLMTLSEAGASDLLIEVPVLGTGSGREESGTELSRRVTDEFALLGRNIRNLFEGIRLGSVQPTESAAYVDSLVELSERGRDRLNAAIIREGEAGSVRAAQAAAVFGKSFSAVDLRLRQQDEIPWFSSPGLDEDGTLRRVSPVITRNETPLEHIAYHALKPRWDKSVIEITETGSVLENRFMIQDDEILYRFPMDRGGNILFEKPGKPGDRRDGFRRISLDVFLKYDQADRDMVRLLKDAEAPGIYAATEPEKIPLILSAYAEGLQEELLAAPDEEKLAAWKQAREEYINSLDDFLYGPSEMILVNGYEELIATEIKDENGIAKLQNMRDEIIRTFVAMRERHRELVSAHSVLMQTLDASFCIMGPSQNSVAGYIPESSALLANALLTGRCITPGQSLHIVILSVIVSFATLAVIHALGPVVLLLAGLAASFLCGAVFGISFIFSAYWIDPFIPAAACLGGTLIMAVSKFGIGYRRQMRFRLACLPSVNKIMLKALVQAGRPLLSETVCAYAAVIAAKNPVLYGNENEDKTTPLEASRAATEFRKTFSQVFKQVGALVLSCEGDTALACFGSPHERIYMEKTQMAERYIDGPEEPGGIHPAEMAVCCVKELLARLKTETDLPYAGWHFGIESGECAFSWSEETGLTVNGQPAIRAKMYATLALRQGARLLLGKSAKAAVKTEDEK